MFKKALASASFGVLLAGAAQAASLPAVDATCGPTGALNPIEFLNQDITPDIEFTVDAGSFDDTFTLDIGVDGSVSIDFNFVGLSSVGAATTWTVSGFGGALTNFESDSGNPTGVLGTGFDGDGFFVNFADISTAAPPETISFNFQLTAETATVPLPAGGALLLAGLGALAFARKRRS